MPEKFDIHSQSPQSEKTPEEIDDQVHTILEWAEGTDNDNFLRIVTDHLRDETRTLLKQRGYDLQEFSTLESSEEKRRLGELLVHAQNYQGKVAVLLSREARRQVAQDPQLQNEYHLHSQYLTSIE